MNIIIMLVRTYDVRIIWYIDIMAACAVIARHVRRALVFIL